MSRLSRLKIEDARSKASAKIAVLGAGFTGLTAAYYLAKKGHQVVVFEKESQPGGLARGFKLSGWSWTLEQNYHHFFASDTKAFKLIDELGLSDKLFFKKPVTAIYYKKLKIQNSKFKTRAQKLKLKIHNSEFRIHNSGIYPLDTPFNFLLFPHLSPIDKLRSGLALAYLKTTPFCQRLERVTARDWIIKNMGPKAWQILWKPLFLNKFGKFADKVPTSWFWARIKKRSQKLGYLKGGFQALADKLVEEIKKFGGKFYFNSEIQKITLSKDKKSPLQLQNLCYDRIINFYFEKVAVTLPTPVFLKIAKSLFQNHQCHSEFSPESKPQGILKPLNSVQGQDDFVNYLKRLSSVSHFHSLTLILRLKKPFLKKTYWLNICDSSFPFLLLVEQTNFIEPRHYNGDHLLYIGNYLPDHHPYLSKSQEELLEIFLPYLQKINPSFHFEPRTSNLERFLSPFAQPVFPLNYSQTKPPLTTPIPNLFLANQDQVYPWDRGVNYAIELGKKVAELIEVG